MNNKMMDRCLKRDAVLPQDGGTLAALETYFLLFVTGSVIGWFYELLFYLIVEHRLTNSGFFYGPYLPIYGFGALFILLFTYRLKKHPLAVFLVTIPVTGVLEYATGKIMFQLFEARWWDYRNLFCNIEGFVCLRSVLTFAVGALLLDYFVWPCLCYCSARMGKKWRLLLCLALAAIFFSDILLTSLFRVPKLL